VESSSKYERVLDSRGGCDKFDHEIQLPHSVLVRDGAGVEDDQTGSSRDLVEAGADNEHVLFLQNNGIFLV
jgi:hypothetical protein